LSAAPKLTVAALLRLFGADRSLALAAYTTEKRPRRGSILTGFSAASPHPVVADIIVPRSGEPNAER
jgi:hypothetical protein